MIEVGMPILLLVLAFVMKLFVDKVAGLFDFILSIFELPTEISFLAISMVVAYTISSPSNNKSGMCWFVAYLVAVFLVIVIWRRSTNLLIQTSRGTQSLNQNRKGVLGCMLGILNYTIAITCLVHSISLVMP